MTVVLLNVSPILDLGLNLYPGGPSGCSMSGESALVDVALYNLCR